MLSFISIMLCLIPLQVNALPKVTPPDEIVLGEIRQVEIQQLPNGKTKDVPVPNMTDYHPQGFGRTPGQKSQYGCVAHFDGHIIKISRDLKVAVDNRNASLPVEVGRVTIEKNANTISFSIKRADLTDMSKGKDTTQNSHGFSGNNIASNMKIFLSRSNSSNLTVDLSSRNSKFFEADLRLRNFDTFLEKLFGPEGYYARISPQYIDLAGTFADKIIGAGTSHSRRSQQNIQTSVLQGGVRILKEDEKEVRLPKATAEVYIGKPGDRIYFEGKGVYVEFDYAHDFVLVDINGYYFGKVQLSL